MMRNRHGTPVLGVAGWKNAGKTTLAIRLIEYFSLRGMQVASVKHAHHSFHIDEGSEDSARHRKAGGVAVAIVSPVRWAVITETPGTLPEPDFEDVINLLGRRDLIIVEGYKSQPIPKIEARRSESLWHEAMSQRDPHVFAIASDQPDHDAARETIPVFPIDDIASIAQHAMTHLDLSFPSALNAGNGVTGAACS